MPPRAIAGVLALSLAPAIAACHGEEYRRELPAALPEATAGPPRAAPVGPPRPLVVIMTQLEGRMAEAASGLWREDYAAIERAGLGIAGHAEILPDEVRRLRAVLGPRFEDFEAGDRAVHEAAQMLALAGRRRDLTAASRYFEAIEQSCVGCHSAVRAATLSPPQPR